MLNTIDIEQPLHEVPLEQPKLCVTCKYVATNHRGEWEAYKCFAPQNKAGINLVTGDVVLRDPLCHMQRNVTNTTILAACGKRGSWYEPRPDKIELTAEQYHTVMHEKKSLKSIGLGDL